MQELIIKMESNEDEKAFIESIRHMPTPWLKHYYKMLREREQEYSFNLEVASDDRDPKEHDMLVEKELDCLVMIMALARVLYSKNVDVHQLDMEAISVG